MNFTIGQLNCIASLKQRLINAIKDNDGKQEVTIVVNAVELCGVPDHELDKLTTKLGELLCSACYIVEVTWARQGSGDVAFTTSPVTLLLM